MCTGEKENLGKKNSVEKKILGKKILVKKYWGFFLVVQIFFCLTSFF